MKKKSCAFALLVVMMLSLGAVAEETQPLVNLFLFETNVRDALSEISMQTGVNIIPDSTVSGLVTVDLQDVPLERALRMILIGGGYAFKKIDDFYLVGPARSPQHDVCRVD